MIEFQNVSKRYPNGFEALKDINLKIGQGEFVAVIGLSGAGKSTLIRTINRMHDITGGTLTVDGINVMELQGKSLRAFRRKIGMIFQSFNLITRTTVIKNVLTAFVPERRGAKIDMIEDACEISGLEIILRLKGKKAASVYTAPDCSPLPFHQEEETCRIQLSFMRGYAAIAVEFMAGAN